jgi:membrane protein implicated in regulation of membrane protease activity
MRFFAFFLAMLLMIVSTLVIVVFGLLGLAMLLVGGYSWWCRLVGVLILLCVLILFCASASPRRDCDGEMCS